MWVARTRPAAASDLCDRVGRDHGDTWLVESAPGQQAWAGSARLALTALAPACDWTDESSPLDVRVAHTGQSDPALPLAGVAGASRARARTPQRVRPGPGRRFPGARLAAVEPGSGRPTLAPR